MENCCKIADSTEENVPKLVHELIEKLLSKTNEVNNLKENLIYCIIKVLLLENGLLPFIENVHNEQAQCEEWIRDVLFQEKNQSGAIEMIMYLKGFVATKLKVILRPMSSLILINAILPDIGTDTYALCVQIDRYVKCPNAVTIPQIFLGLRQLSIVFKNTIITPVVSKILSHHGYPSASLIGLPEEVLRKIMLMLPARDVICLSEVCWSLNCIANQDVLWQELWYRDFKHLFYDSSDDSQGESKQKSWKEQYKTCCVIHWKKPKIVNHCTAGTMHDLMDYYDYVSYVDNAQWNGFDRYDHM